MAFADLMLSLYLLKVTAYAARCMDLSHISILVVLLGWVLMIYHAFTKHLRFVLTSIP
jgi:hypothetical protein